MKKILLLFCLICLLLTTRSQDNVIDSFKILLTQTNDDSARIMILCQLSDAFAGSQPDSAMYYAQQGLLISKTSDFKKGEARSLTRIGNILKSIGNYPKALETILASLKISEEIDDYVGIAASYNNMAEIYKDQNDYTQAVSYYFQTKKIFEKTIADLELKLKKNPSKADQEKLNRNKTYLGTLLLNIGDVYEKMNRLDSSLIFQQQSLALATENNDISIIGAIHNNIGAVYLKQNKPDEALTHYRVAIPYLKEIEDNEFLSNVNQGIAEIFEKKGLNDSAIFYAKQSFSLANESAFQKEVYSSATLLSKLYESAQNADSALAYNKIARTAADSMFNAEKIMQVQKLSFNEKYRQQQIEEERKIAEKERKDNLQNLGIVIFLITLFGILFIIRRRRAHPKAIESLGLLGLLLLFEFISVFLHPYVGELTHHTPVYILLIYVCIAGLLVPLHHRLNHWVKHKLAVVPGPKKTVKKNETVIIKSQSPVVIKPAAAKAPLQKAVQHKHPKKHSGRKHK